MRSLPVLVMAAGLASCLPARSDDIKAKAEAAASWACVEARAKARQAGGDGQVLANGQGAQQHQAPAPPPPVYSQPVYYYQSAPVYRVTQWWNGWGNSGVNCGPGG